MTERLCKISLFSAVLTSIIGIPSVSDADSRGNYTYAGAYNQVMTVQQQQEYINAQNAPLVQTASATEDLPVAVDDKQLAQDIKNNQSDSVQMVDLEQCSMIDIRGVFKWGIPESGMRQTTQPQCIAVVDLKDANSGKVLATTTVAAGDAIKCNIDMFPESGYQAALGEVVLPADEPPTEKDVEKALNKEQKQNAGFKIAAAAIIGGLAGNALAPKAADDSKLLGTSKTQLADTAIGALAAGGIMAASSYSGKVAGDTIKSTAVNATAGMLVGNMAAGMSNTGSVLATTKCKIPEGERDCVIGQFYEIGEAPKGTYYTNQNGTTVYKCTNPNNSDTRTCSPYNTKLLNIKLQTTNSSVDLPTNSADFTSDKFTAYYFHDNYMVKEKNWDEQNPVLYYEIASADSVSASTMAYAVFDKLPSKAFGYKVSDFDSLKPTGYYRRYNNSTEAGERLDTDKKKFKFQPSARSSEDGGIIDLSNEARAKATIAGTAAGGALGGFVGYQGAQSDIYERWVTAMNEYTGSLSNFYCATGGRFLAQYNDYAQVPQLPASNKQD